MDVRYSTDFELYGYFIALLKIFRIADTRLDGHKISPIFWEQGSGELGFADPHVDGNHPPAIRHHTGDGFDGAAMFRGNRDKEPRSRSTPEDDLPAEFDVHGWSISNTSKTPADLSTGVTDYFLTVY